MTVLRRLALRAVGLLLSVACGVYLSILAANMGGYVDEIRRAQIREAVGSAVMADPALARMTPEERDEILRARIEREEKRLGLDRPFFVRSLVYLREALTLSLGRAETMTSDKGSREVRAILLERLPATLLLFGTANLLNFFLALEAALFLSRRYSTWQDRSIVALAPTSAAPEWFYGILFILLFAAVLRWFPFGGMVAAPPPESTWAYLASLGRHLVLPVCALLAGSLFFSIYNWRTFFLIYANEDYVEVAKAKGLPPRLIERRYILRPTLPPILTSFAFQLISLWMGVITLETVFAWPGLGRTLFQAIGHFDTPVIVGSVVVYAYLLAGTVFLLDVLYALVDPRVRAGMAVGADTAADEGGSGGAERAEGPAS